MPEVCWEKKRQAQRLEESAVVLSQEFSSKQVIRISADVVRPDVAFGPRAR